MSIGSWIRGLRSANGRRNVLLLAGGALVGVVVVVAFDISSEATNTTGFCVSCHELRENALAEFVGTPHHTNASGVRVGCPDCHVPHDFFKKMHRKMRSVSEVYHHLLGTIDTPEKYDAHRMEMARKTWSYMEANDSLTCRGCHDPEHWDPELQSPEARKYHASSLANGKTCIDCHKGLAHDLPAGIEEDTPLEEIGP